MKKILIITFLILVLFCGGLYFYSSKKNVGIEFYSPYEASSYVYSSDRQISFDIYSKEKRPLILNKEKNTYTIKMEDLSLELEDISINAYDIGDKYLIKLYASMPDTGLDEYMSQSLELIIKNSKYTLRLPYGPISFLKEDTYSLLPINSLSGSYSYINGILTLVGINIELLGEYESLNSIRIGSNLIGTLSQVIFDKSFDSVIDINEIIPKYSISKTEYNRSLGLTSNKLFIPLGYKTISILRFGYIVLKLDGKNYYIDTFSFMTNSLEFLDYKDLMVKGEITYA